MRDMAEAEAAAEVEAIVEEEEERRREDEVEAEREDVEAERDEEASVKAGSSEECRPGEATAEGRVHRAFCRKEGSNSSTSCLCALQVVATASSHLLVHNNQSKILRRMQRRDAL